MTESEAYTQGIAGTVFWCAAYVILVAISLVCFPAALAGPIVLFGGACVVFVVLTLMEAMSNV